MDNQSKQTEHQIKSKEQLRQEYIDHMLAMHAEWCKHPVTVFLAQNLDKHRELHLRQQNSMVASKEVSSELFRAQAMNVKNTDAIVKLSFDSQSFVNMMVRDINQKEKGN